MIGTVLIPNVIAVVLLLVLLASAKTVSRHMLPDAKIFFTMVGCNLFQCVCEVVAFFLDGKMIPGFHTLLLIINSMLFVVNIMFSFLWVVYADYKIYEDMERLKRRCRILVIPAAVVAIASLVNIFVPVFFRMTENNCYERTVLYAIPFAVTYFYLAYGTVFIYRNKNQARKYVFLPAVVFMLPILLGSAVQYFFYGISTVWIGVAIGLVSVYVNVQNETSYIDALSGVYTRYYMYPYLETELKRNSADKKIAGIMLDIDNFKRINDNCGHLTGDDAIRSAGRLLYGTMANKGIVVRYGGDEFVVLQQVASEDEILQTIEQISRAENAFNSESGREYILEFSRGYSIMNPDSDTIESFLERMDQAMYEAKELRRKNRAKA